MRSVARVAVVLLALVAVPVVARAQALGTIAGSVKDPSGAVLPGVTVEASSPALIEKVRSVTTDGTGLYRIVNLPPGQYVITFALQGFNTVRREAVDVTVGFTLTIDTDLRVGAIQETVTVTGESPIVDIQSAAATRSVTSEMFKELPSGGSWIQMAALVPAIRAGNTDVGGVLGDQTGAQVEAHGSRPGDGVSMIDGMRIGNMYLSSNLTNMSLSPLLSEQVDIQLSGQMADTGTNGVIMNLVPKAGGNRFSGTALVNGSGPGLQTTNITDRLQARGLSATSFNGLKKLYDINGALGGPIAKDRVWFYATSRYFTNNYYLAGRFFPADVTAVNRVNDESNKAYAGTYTYDNNARVTLSISDKQKVSSWYAYQYKVDPLWLLQIFNQSPESSRITTWNTQLSTSKWTYTATNHLLFEAGLMAGASPDTILLNPDAVGNCTGQGNLSPRCIAIVNQTTGFTYRAPTGFDFDDRLPSQTVSFASSYVTGSHNAKVGFELQRGYFRRGDNNESTGGVWYTANQVGTTLVPAFVNINAPATGWQDNLDANLGIYAQDRWTIDRMTVSGGVRLDWLKTSTEPFTLGPHRWLPNRNVQFAAVENVPNWKDINPRVSVAYDVFGTGKTALKGSASRSVQQESIAIARLNNPANTVSTTTNRVWEDDDNDFFPDCDLTNGTAQGTSLASVGAADGVDYCGGWLNANFGSAVPGTRYDSSIMQGWGARPWNWEFSVGLQQEILPRVSASFGYFRRINGNFWATDNEALARTDFTQYSATVPSDPRLPGGGGGTVTGLFDTNILVPARNVVKRAEMFGKQQVHWNGFDLTVDARMRNGLTLQGGFSTGKTLTDNCDVVDDAPEILGGQATQFCHFESPFLTQYKGLASYTLPLGIRVAGTFQSIPGPQIAANTIYNAGNRATATTLSRAFTLAQANVNVVEPGSFYGDRLNQVDLRVTKIVSVGKARVDLNVDFYNAFNSDAVIGENFTFGAFGASPAGPVFRRPLTVIQPMFVKFSARLDF